jgi:hypothetical protein
MIIKILITKIETFSTIFLKFYKLCPKVKIEANTNKNMLYNIVKNINTIYYLQYKNMATIKNFISLQ